MGEKQQSHSGLHPLSSSLSESKQHHDEQVTKMASKDQKNLDNTNSRDIGKENDLETSDEVKAETQKKPTNNKATTGDVEENSPKEVDSKKLSTDLKAKKPLHLKESANIPVTVKDEDESDRTPIEGKKEKSGKSQNKK